MPQTSEVRDIAAAGKPSFKRRNSLGGEGGSAEFTDVRWISVETGPQRYPS